MLRSRRVTLALTVCVLPSCRDESTGTAPPPPPEWTGLRIIAGGSGADTISTHLTQALIVELRDDRGDPIVDHVLRFTTTVADANAPAWGNSAYVSAVDGTEPRTFLAATTDVRGQARAMVILGRKAGTATVVASDPDRGIADTATFTVRPGLAVRVVAAPRDTTVYAGSTFALRNTVLDRAGNERADPVAHSVIGSAIGVSGGIVAAASAGIARVVSSAGPAADTLRVYVPPRGVLAAFHFSRLVTLDTDGSDETLVLDAAPNGISTAWSPSGTEIAFDRNMGGTLRISTLSGAVRNALPAGAWGIDPEYTRDGEWIYYGREGNRLHRVRPDGSGDERVPMLAPAGDLSPSLSPDGSRLVYVRVGINGYHELWMLDLTTGQSTDLRTLGVQPSWSRDGALIAFSGLSDGSNVRVMKPDGTGIRTVGMPGSIYSSSIDWSPDGRWLVARNQNRNRLELINPGTGEIIPVPNSSDIWGPSWKP